MATDKLTTNDLPAKTTVDSNSKKKKAGAKPATSKKAGSAKKTVASEPLVPATAPKASSPAKKTATTKKVSSKEVTAQTVSKKTASPKNTTEKKSLTVTFQVKFHTSFGQNLFVLGNHPLLGDGDVSKALPMHYFNDGIWTASLYWDDEQLPKDTIVYNYILKNPDGTLSYDWGKDKFFIPATYTTQQVLIKDAWNFAGYFENAFYTEPFQKVLLKENHTAVKIAVPKKVTHVFKAKAPLLAKGQTLCLLGSATSLNEWDATEPVLMSRAEGQDAYSVSLNLTKDVFPVAYKYGIYDVEQKQFVAFEEGNNRVLYEAAEADKLTVVNDGFAVFPIAHWKGAGVAIPVFSLRSSQSFGVGEFADIKLLTDWCRSVGLKLIQILPINDTTATHTWTDSYPYAAISAFALHPMYLNLKQVAGEKHSAIVEQLEEQRQTLNALPEVDYEAVVKVKMEVMKQLYPLLKKSTFTSASYKEYFNQNKHWLVPYAVFCYLRDIYGTSDFNQWPEHNQYKEEAVNHLLNEKSDTYDAIAIHYFIQYHLHLQLKEATEYAHQNGIIVKGDIAIGVYRFGADAWQSPDLYHMNMQAGAPPDDFAVKGQNWGFPTYNWHRMKEDGYAWWKQRFEQMSYYFDAFRIDHILGFFRIWSIPMHAVEGIMGHFVPAIPVHINEFVSRGISFDYNRYVKPYINEAILWDVFGYDSGFVKERFLNYDGFNHYALKPEYATQRQVEQHLAGWMDDDFTRKIKSGLFDLISNVLLFEEEGSGGQLFHFRFGMGNTRSFRQLDGETQHKLDNLYVNYFFRRQDDFWMKEAMQKLPALKRVTNMLVCGEDLGLVPSCVPEMMRQLGLLSLEIQRMPKDPTKEFFHPNDAPYLSVVTPSTHDMSTIRGWWEEDKNRIQRFYNHQLGQGGTAPHYCEAWINKAIVLQHLYSPSMWSIFQMQDILGSSEQLRRADPNDERINVPANPKHYWRYRMHIGLEQLLLEQSFNQEFKGFVSASGR